MQPVNDDMDPIFRQAAQEYPLSTGGADFSEVLQRMQASEEDNTPPKKERKRHFLWLLLLLIPLPFVCNHYYTGNKGNNADNSSLVATHAGEENGASKTPANPAVQPGNTASPVVDGKQAAPNQEVAGNLSSPTGNSYATQTPASQPATASTNSTTNNQSIARNSNAYGINKQKAVPGTGAATNNNQPTADNNNTGYRFGNSKKKFSKASVAATASDTYLGSNAYIQKDGTTTISITSPTISGTAAADNTLQAGDSTSTDLRASIRPGSGTAPAAIAKAKNAVKDSTAADTTATASKQKKKQKESFKPAVYAGIIGGPDYSVVKSTQTAGTGYNIGVVAGYRFSKHLAVEAGLLWSYKKYFADSQYIKTDKMELPSRYVQVLNIDGSCGMFEIPVNVQYHFSSKGKGHWYALAGLSSYIMKKEEYYYLYKRYNTIYYAERTYTNSSKNWFSILQLGAGYQWQLGKKTSLRVEPYAKLPIGNIGIAQIPLSSAGLNIGFIRPF